jgi:c-di-GMP-binding flagellar brake protein YcgR
VHLEAQGRRLPVVDVSAGGVAFRAKGPRPGQRFSGQLHLPGEPPASVGLEVVKALDNGVCSCRIIEIGEKDRERIHQYVLRRQKEDLERRRAERLAESAEEGPPGTKA